MVETIKGKRGRCSREQWRSLLGRFAGSGLSVESTVHCLINRRMNKSQQMRWSRQGAELLLRVRAALLNDEFDVLAKDHHPRKAANEDVFGVLPLAA
jgi:hypothetical protein